jgi:hypothetical protein
MSKQNRSTRPMAEHLKLSSLILLALVTPTWGKPPAIKHFFPAGVQVGSETTLEVAGDFADWPVEGVSQPLGLELTAGEEKGKLTVRVPDEAIPGTYLVRLTSAAGVSSWKPLIVSRRLEVMEVEPNDATSSAQLLESSSVVVNGKLANRSDVDVFSVSLKAGEHLVASLLGNEILGSPMDAVIQICDERGFVLRQNDDERGLDPQLVFTAPRDGAYHVRIFAFPAAPNSSIAFASGDDYIYRLTLSAGPFVDHSLPLAVSRADASSKMEVEAAGWNLDGSNVVLRGEAIGSDLRSLVVSNPEYSESVILPLVDHPSLSVVPKNEAGQPQEIPLPAVISGRIDSPDQRDVVRFTAKKDQKLVLRVESRSLGFVLDPVARISSIDGKKLAEMDDASRTDRDILLKFTVPDDGAYDVSIWDLHGNSGLRYSYRATIEPETPTLVLSTPNDALVVKKGETVELPIDLDRQNGFDQEIELVFEGLPEGVSWELPAANEAAEPAEPETPRGQRRRGNAEGAGDEAKKLSPQLKADCEPGHYRFRVRAQAGEDQPAIPLGFRVAGVEYDELWLTVLPSDS